MSKDPAAEAMEAVFAEIIEESTGLTRGDHDINGDYLVKAEIVNDDHIRFSAHLDNAHMPDVEEHGRGYLDIAIVSWAQSSDDIALAALHTGRAMLAFLKTP